jgi:O-antigen/teichoic acid export membrane protein
VTVPTAEAANRPPFVDSAIATYVVQILVAALSLASVLIVARNLGASGRGDVAFLVALSYITSQLASAGVHQANANFAATDPSQRAALATNSVLLSLVLGVIGVSVLVVALWLFPGIGADQGRLRLALAAGAVPMLILATYLLLLVQADYRFRITNIAWLVPPLINAAGNGTLAAVHLLSPGRAFGIWIAGQLISLVVLVGAVYSGAGFGRPDLELGRRSLRFGVQAHFGRVMLLGNYRADQWIVGAISGPQPLGIYSVAVSWAEVLFFVPTVISAVQRPDIARLGKRDAATSAAAGMRAGLLLTLPLAVLLIVAAPFLCETLLGSAFSASVPQLRILTIGAFGIVALKILGGSLTAQSRPNLETLAIGSAFVATLGLDLLLIPGHAGMGAAVASTLAYTAGGVVAVYVFSRTFSFPLRQLVPGRSDPRWLITAISTAGRRFASRST